MFEKEAEEYALVRLPDGYTKINHQKKVDFQKGAEFGYNKANDKIEALEERCEIANDEIIRLQKANEWHYVKDGDLPEEDDVYLVYTTKGVLLGHYEQGGADGETSFTGEPYSDFTEYPSEMLFTEDEVIAWKEIVLPKED